MRVQNRRLANVSLLLLAVWIAAACGGGSASAPEPPAAVASPTPSPPSPAPAPEPSPNPSATEVQFQSTDAELPNPERGLYVWAADELTRWSAADADNTYRQGYRIVYAMVRLDGYRNQRLPDSVLDGLRAGFAVARNAGLKVIPRMTYNYPASETEYRNAQDAPIDRVVEHIAQLKPVLQDNADVIAFFQAGFVGAWGEWHTSSNGLTSPENRTRIRDALLGALPGERFLQLRYPPYLLAWSPQAPTVAFDGSAASRVGLHNDCFLASDTDVGTYSDDAMERTAQRNYVQALSRVAPFGGETCNPADDASAVPRSSCDAILAEGRQFGLTYLNDSYHRPLFHEQWQAQGCMAQVRRSMGYRFALSSAKHAPVWAAGQPQAVSLAVRNNGWARLYNPRPTELVLKHRSSGTVLRLPLVGADARQWLPGQTSNVQASVTLPADTATGEYDVHMAWPDAAASLRGDARYAVRPANADDANRGQNWDAALGAFRLGSTIRVR
jgi:hypothetical protein